MAEPTNIPGGIPMKAHLTMRAAWQQVEGEAPGWRSRPSEAPEGELQRSPEKNAITDGGNSQNLYAD